MESQEEREEALSYTELSPVELKERGLFSEKKLRPCLMCRKSFLSEGNHNWRCPKCHKLTLSQRDFFHEPIRHKVTVRTDGRTIASGSE